MLAFFAFVVAILAAIPALASPVEPRELLSQKAKTPIDADTYANLLKYPAYITYANYLTDTNCTNPPYSSHVEAFINAHNTDTQLAIFRNDADRELVVAIPGTHGQQDYLTDFTFIPVPYDSPDVDCPLCTVHVGFLSAWNSVADASRSTLDGLREKYPDYGVVVAGKSLGGALAQLAYTSFAAGGVPIKAAYTYGQPRVGSILVANYVDKLAGATDTEPGIYHRVTHSNDGVPQLPPSLAIVFKHPRTEYWESLDQVTLETTYRCFGQEPDDCNNQAGGVGINAAHKDYANEDYACMTT